MPTRQFLENKRCLGAGGLNNFFFLFLFLLLFLFLFFQTAEAGISKFVDRILCLMIQLVSGAFFVVCCACSSFAVVFLFDGQNWTLSVAKHAPQQVGTATLATNIILGKGGQALPDPQRVVFNNTWH